MSIPCDYPPWIENPSDIYEELVSNDTPNNQYDWNMASLAILVAIIMLSFWMAALFGLVFSFLGFKFLGFLFGIFSILSGVYLLVILPYAPILGVIQLVAGSITTFRYFKNNELFKKFYKS